MQNRAELKEQAKATLKGHWKQAVLLNLVPSLIGLAIVLIIFIPLILILVSTVDFSSITDTSGATASNTGYNGNLGVNSASGIIGALFMSGISWTYLDVLRGKKTQIEPFKDAFRGFSGVFIGGIIGLAFLIAVFTTLWSLLFIIPGIVKSYSYSQSYFLYYDAIQNTGNKPSVLDTITASRKLMDGYKKDLFFLDLSFIGWHILAIFTLGIGYLWLNPYITVSKALFYENLPKGNIELLS